MLAHAVIQQRTPCSTLCQWIGDCLSVFIIFIQKCGIKVIMTEVAVVDLEYVVTKVTRVKLVIAVSDRDVRSHIDNSESSSKPASSDNRDRSDSKHYMDSWGNISDFKVFK